MRDSLSKQIYSATPDRGQSLGFVDISLQSDNREVCTDTCFFVGVGLPNPLFTRQRRFRVSVGRFSKIDVSVSRYESRPTIYNQFNPSGLGFPTRFGQWAREPRPYDYRQLYTCQHALTIQEIL